jgi:hypothetical protein
MSDKHTKWMFIVFPAVAMLLGWGLRGHIGGGPFGAMIPGAMVALSLCMLLKLPTNLTAIIVVFGVVGIGLGGEMTYGQTLGFLKHPETMWWGVLATTVKGAVWGVLGATVLSIGFLYNRLKKKTIAVGFLLMMLGLLVGFKLINEPMLIYFSDPEKPRPESWGALLIGTIFLLTYLKYKVAKDNFKIVSRFATFGLIGGGLGFGLGGFWFVLGSALPKEVIFKSWWKAMEFSFGFLLGTSLGYATWLSRKEIILIGKLDQKPPVKLNIYKELGLTLLVGLLIYWVIPSSLEPFVAAANVNDGIFMSSLRAVAQILINYSFYGSILVAVTMYLPQIAWQIGITLTFCHTAIDFIEDYYSDLYTNAPFIAALWVLLLTLIVALLTAYFRRKNDVNKSLFNLLVWSTMTISYLAFLVTGLWNVTGFSFTEILFRYYFVDLTFTISALYVSWFAINKIKNINKDFV